MKYRLSTGTVFSDDSLYPRVVAVRRPSVLHDVDGSNEQSVTDAIVLASNYEPRGGEACVVVLLNKNNHAIAYRATAIDDSDSWLQAMLRKVLR